jgi:hypothetical protein
MRMIVRVGVEMAFCVVDHHFLYQARIAERAQRIVDGGQ